MHSRELLVHVRGVYMGQWVCNTLVCIRIFTNWCALLLLVDKRWGVSLSVSDSALLEQPARPGEGNFGPSICVATTWKWMESCGYKSVQKLAHKHDTDVNLMTLMVRSCIPYSDKTPMKQKARWLLKTRLSCVLHCCTFSVLSKPL